MKNLYEKAYYKKREYKKKIKEIEKKQKEDLLKIERELDYHKQKLLCDKKDFLIQTEIDTIEFIKMQRNHDLVTYYHKIVNFFLKKNFRNQIA